MGDAGTLTPPTLLTDAHDTSAFDSGEAVLDDWLRRRALPNLLTLASRTYVVCPVGSPQVIAYATLSMGQILAREVAGSMPRFIPAVILGRLAIDRTWQGQGLGRALLAEAVERSLRASREVSTRLLVVHAISPAAEMFYLHHGFTRFPVEAPVLALDLLKLQAVTR